LGGLATLASNVDPRDSGDSSPSQELKGKGRSQTEEGDLTAKGLEVNLQEPKGKVRRTWEKVVVGFMHS